MAKLVKQTSAVETLKRIPQKGELFFDQGKQQPGKIVATSDQSSIVVEIFGTKKVRKGFRFQEIEWSERCEWWTFKQEKPRYQVWVENVAAEDALNKKGTWELAVNVPLSQETAKTIEKLLKQEHPEVDFATSISRPSSYFF